MALVLARKPGEKILIGDDIEVIVTMVRVGTGRRNYRAVKDCQVHLAIIAPKSVKILREEVAIGMGIKDANQTGK